jgi:hypothetical protein
MSFALIINFREYQKIKGITSPILNEGLNYISENQEEKYKYAHNNFISVLFKELN